MENNSPNHDNVFPIGVHQGLDENTSMTANFLNGMHDYDLDDFENEKKQKLKIDRRASYGMENYDDNK